MTAQPPLPELGAADDAPVGAVRGSQSEDVTPGPEPDDAPAVTGHRAQGQGSSPDARSGRVVWHLVNTTVRNPYRLRGGLQALVDAGFAEDMGKSREEAMARALDKAGVISLSESTSDITSIARKWRSALTKLGLIWPDGRSQGDADPTQLGPPHAVTPNGHRLLAAETMPGQREVLLRAIAALRLPSPIETGYAYAPFSPLRHIIRVLTALDGAGEDAHLSPLEMASIVITGGGDGPVEELARRIAGQRRARAAAPVAKRFDGEALQSASQAVGGPSAGTLLDYQDVTFRYLKATGLFQSRGRGIELAPESRALAELLAAEPELEMGSTDYLVRLADGAVLPTDSAAEAAGVLREWIAAAQARGIPVDSELVDSQWLGRASVAELTIARHQLEEAIFEAKEAQFALRQRDELNEILAYLEILDGGRTSVTVGDESIRIHRGERPAYFEWALWRLMLACGGLDVPPHRVRRFSVDADFLPMGTAPGGGADVIAEYADSVLVVEVTLMESSRQEAAEGEPVRRHVADVLNRAEPEGKSVLGLFVAPSIDNNTAETFRVGCWYRGDDRLTLDIVPLSLGQLRSLVRRLAGDGRLTHTELLAGLVDCLQSRTVSGGAPEWKAAIAASVGA